MSTKKKIKNIIAEHSAKLAKGFFSCQSTDRKIYLTDKDYVRVYIFGTEIELGLHMNNSEFYMLYKDGSINDLDSVWRRFRYRFKSRIAEEKEYGDDKAFAAKLKEVYSLL